jgi:transposase
MTLAMPQTRAEREAIVRELRNQGLVMREIAEIVGLSTSTVDAYLNDPGGHRLKARKASYAGACVDCGAPTNGNAGPGKACMRCLDCGGRFTAELSRRRWLAHRVQIEAMWADGYTMREIAREMGLKYDKAMTSRMRANGYDLPYRRTPEQVRRIVAASDGNLAKARRVHAEMRAVA